MKKVFISILFLLFTSVVFAEGITGLFGIPFETSEKDTVAVMTEKGWLSNSYEEEHRVEFTKTGGTYATLPVTKITMYFFNDKFYKVFIATPVLMGNEVDHAADVYLSLIESYNLKVAQIDDKAKVAGHDAYLVSALDKNNNALMFEMVSTNDGVVCMFSLVNNSINTERIEEENRQKDIKKQEQKQAISSDL